MKSVLYVTTPGAYVAQTSGRLRVLKGKELLQELRIEDVERIVVLSGAAGVTPGAATALMEAGVETSFLSSTGIFRGWLSSAKGRSITLRVAQYTAYADPARRLSLARYIVAGKIQNCDTMLARFARNHADFDPSAERARLSRSIASARIASSLESLLGYEGDAAATYFQAFGRMLRHGFAFTVRSRRPPRDPANALLSFGYTLLASEATSAVAGAGLDPALGMLHTPEDGRPSLGLDLTEEFRQAVVDRLILHLANNKVLSPGDFEEPKSVGTSANNGYRLKPEPRRKFLLAYEERMTSPFRERESGPPTCLRDCLRGQAVVLARAIRDGNDYPPFALK